MIFPQKGQDITVDIEGLVYGGEGRARYGAYDVLVPRGMPGDRLVARVSSIREATIRADIVEVLVPSPARRQPICPAFQEGCGGCQWLHMAYDAQLAWKRRLVEHAIHAYDTLAGVSIRNVIGMADPFFYRNKMVVRVRGPQENLRVGFQDARRWVLNVFNREDGQCYIQHPLNNRLGRALAASLRRERRPLKAATIRTSEEEEVSLDLDRKLAAALSADLEGIGRQSAQIHYAVLGRRFRVTAPSFFQANTRQTAALVEAALGFLPAGRIRTAIDVYCGVGLFTLFLAERADAVYGIEEAHTAVEDAQYNAGVHAASNVRFIREKAEIALPGIIQEAGPVDVMLIDPPRSGCHPALLDTISRCRPRVLIYVSCNVDALARDLARLYGLGLPVADVQPVDMFPHTYHIECVARCTA
jgi:23S rRNA (uracil1939-C5)-methyltransferase